MRVRFDDPPGIDVTVSCLDCAARLQMPKRLLSAQALSVLVHHILDHDHEIVIHAHKER